MSEQQENVDHVAVRLAGLMNEWWLTLKVFVEPTADGAPRLMVVGSTLHNGEIEAREVRWNGREEEWQVIAT